MPRAQFVKWMTGSRNILGVSQKEVTLLNITIRFLNHDTEAFLPYAKDESGSYAFVLYYRLARSSSAELELEALHNALVELTLECNGTFYLPYRHHYSDEQLATSYPGIGDFFAAKQRFDPCNRFSNAWFRRYGARYGSVATTRAHGGDGGAGRISRVAVF